MLEEIGNELPRSLLSVGRAVPYFGRALWAIRHDLRM